MTDADTELRLLLDKEAIRDVLLRYSRAVDRCDAALLLSVYHEGATESHGGLHEGSAEAFALVALDWLRRLGPTAHYLCNVLIDLAGDRATVESYGLAFHRIQMDGQFFDSIFGARLIDRFERREGEWRIAHRHVVYDWNRDQPVAETWGRGFFGGQPIVGRKDREDPAYWASR